MKAVLYGLGVLLFVICVFGLQTPEIFAPAVVDISYQNLIINISYDGNDTLLFFDNSSFYVNSSYVEIENVSVGNHTFWVCSYSLNDSECSNNMSVLVINGSEPEILSVGYVGVYPNYMNDVKGGLEIQVRDPRSITINGSFWLSEEDYYGGEFGEILEMNCYEVNKSGDVHFINCSFNVSSEMPPGFYDVRIEVDNSYMVVGRSFAERIVIHSLLSVDVSKPEFDFSDVYNEWVDAEEPVGLLNSGNVLLNKIGLKIGSIKCDEYVFENIMLSDKDNRGAAVNTDRDGFVWFDDDIFRGEVQEIFVFVHNPEEIEPDDCEYEWSINLRYVE